MYVTQWAGLRGQVEIEPQEQIEIRFFIKLEGFMKKTRKKKLKFFPSFGFFSLIKKIFLNLCDY